MQEAERPAAVAPAERESYGVHPDGARLPDGTRLGCVRLQVSDLARSLAYYQSVLGLRLLHRSGAHASLAAHEDDRPLVELRERAGAAPMRQRGTLGLYHFAILLPDRGSLGRFIAHLAEIGERAGAADHLVSEALYLQDPDNLGIEVYADRPRDQWKRRGRELVMATEQLDVAEIARAAGGDKWHGLPRGTVLGHVHLHVGDLGQASALYHQALGLDAMVWSYPGALFLAAGGYHHHLGLNTWAGANAVPPREQDARLLEWEIVTPRAEDAEAAANRLMAAGHPVTPADSVAAWGGGWLATDPCGTSFRIR